MGEVARLQSAPTAVHSARACPSQTAHVFCGTWVRLRACKARLRRYVARGPVPRNPLMSSAASYAPGEVARLQSAPTAARSTRACPSQTRTLLKWLRGICCQYREGLSLATRSCLLRLLTRRARLRACKARLRRYVARGPVPRNPLMSSAASYAPGEVARLQSAPTAARSTRACPSQTRTLLKWLRGICCQYREGLSLAARSCLLRLLTRRARVRACKARLRRHVARGPVPRNPLISSAASYAPGEGARLQSAPTAARSTRACPSQPAHVFCGFLRAAGNRILFNISRYPGECLCKSKFVGIFPSPTRWR